jgi:plasmid stabilization system protein ParE
VGLGGEFMACLDDVFETVGNNAELFQVVEPMRQIRRALCRRFPYAAYYIIESQRSRVVILAVLPAAMGPKRWRGRR